MFQRVYLDSNIIIAALGGDANPELAHQLIALIDSASSRPSQSYITSELTLAEVLVLPMRAEQDLSTIDNALTTSDWLDVAPISRNILWGAANLRSQHRSLKLPDAIHIATAVANRCSHILTADGGLRGQYSVRLGFPTGNGTSPAVEIIRPETDVLAALVEWQTA